MKIWRLNLLFNNLESIFVTSEKTKYIPDTHSGAMKAALETREEKEGSALYIPGYVQLTIAHTEMFAEDDWITDRWLGTNLLYF